MADWQERGAEEEWDTKPPLRGEKQKEEENRGRRKKRDVRA